MFSPSKKLLVSSSVLLLSVSGFSTFNWSSLSVESLFKFSPSWGGASTHNLGNYGDSRKVQLENEIINNIAISKSQENSKIELEAGTQQIDLKESDSLEINNSDQNIKQLYKETERETESLNLIAEGSASVTASSLKTESRLEDYQSARGKIEKWMTQQNGNASASPRSKRGVDFTSPIELTVKERNALLELYKEFDSLSTKKESYDPRVRRIDESLVGELKDVNRQSSSIVASKLREIGWTSQQEIKFSEYPIPSRGRITIPRGGSSAWANWNNNPYSLFLNNQTEYNSLLQGVVSAQQQLTNYTNTQRVRGGLRRSFVPGPEAQKYKNGLSNAKSELVLKVASKLLSWMNQTPSKRLS